MLCALNGSVLHGMYATLMQSQPEDTRLQDCEGMAELRFEMISNLVLSFLTIICLLRLIDEDMLSQHITCG